MCREYGIVTETAARRSAYIHHAVLKEQEKSPDTWEPVTLCSLRYPPSHVPSEGAVEEVKINCPVCAQGLVECGLVEP